jgi:predicted O-linked N-acetylglucosamine transferase (SPINDLY family)
MNSKEEIFDEAKRLHVSGNINDAKKLYLKLIGIDKNNFLFQNLLGTTFLQLKEYDEAIKHLDISIKLNPNFAVSFGNKGIAHAEKKQYREAINNYDKAINLNKKFFDAYLNKGIALKNIHKYDDALKYYYFCIKVNAGNPKIYSNLGNLLLEQKKFKEALKVYDKAISLHSKFAEVYNSRGETNQQLGNYKEAIEDYSKALKINNNLSYVKGKILFAKMHINEWDNFDLQISQLIEEIDEKKKTITPFPLLSLIDDPKMHKGVAEKYSKDNFPFFSNKKQITTKLKNKINIGYYSADFKDHAVLHLISDVFRNHNKSQFNIYGFSYGLRKDKMTYGISKYFHNFFECTNLSDEEIANLSQKNNIHVAIDLAGYTLNSRVGIFHNNPAPIKINYLGYPGTMGTKCYDYIIADEIVLPKKEKKFFTEQILYLPNCYQANQLEIEISQKKLTKEEAGLPEENFVFGCLNNNYKITPLIFNSWMKILKDCKKSILWLLEVNDEGKKNLAKEALKRGVDPKRIIFAKKLPVAEHLERIKYIDLFLDTFPYNAHTTASEVIRMGVPIVTLKGCSFASRVSSSILKNVGLEKLIVNNIDDYTNVAIKIANNKGELTNLKNHLTIKDNTTKLFDSKKFTENLEEIYKNIIKLNNQSFI